MTKLDTGVQINIKIHYYKEEYQIQFLVEAGSFRGFSHFARGSWTNPCEKRGTTPVNNSKIYILITNLMH